MNRMNTNRMKKDTNDKDDIQPVTDDNERCKIVNFLEQIIDKYRLKQLNVEEEKRITEFYIKERFLQECGKETGQDPLTYLALGWYIYEELYKTK